jgi:hypothetical protein
VDGFTGTQLASDPFGETFAVAGRGGREVRFRRLASSFAGLDGFAEILLAQREPILALAHPNLVTTVAVARDGKGRLIVAEGLPSGPSLAACLEVAARSGSALGRDLALQVARALVSALAHLHAAGLVHGLVHPRSVYLDPAGGVRLGDVAVAHAVAVAIGQAPELAGLARDELAPPGDDHPIDRRLDVHRTGALIRMLLAAAGDAPAGRLAELVDRATAADARERHADGAELLVHLEEVVGPAGDPAIVQRELERLVADTLAASPVEEMPAAASVEAAEIAGEVERLAEPAEVPDEPVARPAAPTVERPSVRAPGAGLLGRVRALPRAPLLLVAAESVVAVALIVGLMSDGDPAPAAAPPPAAPLAAESPPPVPIAAVPAEPALSPPGRCVLNVRSNPPEATVVIDGLSAGVTPVSVVGVRCDSPLNVTVDKVGFESMRKQVQLADGEPFHLQATLQRPKVMLRVASTPAGAQVAINGKPVGRTPLAVELSAFADAGVLLQMKGYRPYRATVVPSAQKEIVAQLVPLRGRAAARGRGPAAMSAAARPPRPRSGPATQIRK